ncbi:MAG: CBS domain-containing protein [Candidatus Methanomethylicaceae archaeon]
MASFPVTSVARHPPAAVFTMKTKVIDAIRMMNEKSVRHAIVSNDGQRIDGLVSAKDIINFLGGGEKFRILKEKFGENIHIALDSPIEPIVNMRPIVARVSDTLPEVMCLMAKHDIGMIPLLDEQDRIWGSLSERHLFRLFEANQMFVKVFEIMSKPLITLDNKATLLDLSRMMIGNDIRRIPIMKDGQLWGIVTVKDIIRFLASPYVDDVINKGLSNHLFHINVSKISTLNPKTVSPDVDLSDAVKIMNANNVGSLIVVSSGRPIGILTERDLLLKLPRLRGVEFMTDANRNRVIVGRIHF